MKMKYAALLCIAFALFGAATASATTRTVVTTSSQCTSTNAPCYISIQQAINESLANDEVLIERGEYLFTGATITLNNNIGNFKISGRETVTTKLSGNGSGPIFTTSGFSSALIRRLTFLNALTGIQATNNNGSLNIENNVFLVGTGGTAVSIQNSPGAQVINNTFYSNGTALSQNSDINVTNNAFVSNATAISTSISVTNNFNNAFFSNSITGPTGSNPVVPVGLSTDPLFVAPLSGDFHLKSGSPLIDTGNTGITDLIDPTFPTSQSDIGAYGGANADTIPVQVANVSTAGTTSTPTTVSWTANPSYVITGYKLYYGTSTGIYNGTGAAEGPSPVKVLSGATSTTLTSLASSTIPPGSPTFLLSSPRDQSLELNWTPVAGATGYKIYYSTSPFTSSTLPSNPQVSPTNSFTLSGLTNGQTYYIAVSAVVQTIYYVAVTAFDAAGETAGVPGISHESVYSSPEKQIFVGSPQESAISPVISDFPEELTAFPNLPDSNKKCFIATAAFGYYSAPEVQALRTFRDRYLLTTSLGRAFVDWYYEHGPAAAAYLNEHPGYKPAVRAALLPAIGMATFMNETSLPEKALAMLLACSMLISGLSIYRRKRSHKGEAH